MLRQALFLLQAICGINPPCQISPDEGARDMKILGVILKWIGIGLLCLIVLFVLIFVALPKGPRDLMQFEELARVPKKLVSGERYAVVTGTPWATEAAIEVLDNGGNAYDAAVASLLVLNVTNGVHASFPCIAPTMIFDARTGEVRSYIGAGKAPAAATLDAFLERGWETMSPIDIWSQLLPASPDVMIALLQDYGTRSFSELAAPAIRIAREGFPAHELLMVGVGEFGAFERIGYRLVFPYNSKVWFQDEWWRPIHLHDRMRFPDLADTFERMANAEQAVLAAGGTRAEGLQAVWDLFYQGALAEQIVAFHEQKGGLFTLADLAEYAGGWEEPISGSYGEYTLFTNSGWSQGMVGPLALQILEGIDLQSMGHNSPQYIHTVAQALELAMADRDAYVGDPAFVEVPWDVLMSKQYAAQRRQAMTERAFGPLPAAGQIEGFPQSGDSSDAGLAQLADDISTGLASFQNDTTQLAILDQWGNAVVMTPSDFPWTPMVPGTGITLGNRMNQFRLDADNVDVVAPGKRPRVTPHAVIVFKDNRFYMAYSTPGGDMQPQALVQVFLNMHVFGMDIQQAVSAPRFYSISAPSSFAPHEASPGTLRLEADLYASAASGLEVLGYTLVEDTIWHADFGGVGAIMLAEDGTIQVGADPRWETWGIAR
jgi:gamma-glutamyltranspeptidase/glutathione hydrolase